jgi:hypothetical protein
MSEKRDGGFANDLLSALSEKTAIVGGRICAAKKFDKPSF